jgi:hypothetical protein
MRIDLFMGKLNPDKFSQILEKVNKYLEYTPIEKRNPKRMAYGQALPDDEIRSIICCLWARSLRNSNIWMTSINKNRLC